MGWGWGFQWDPPCVTPALSGWNLDLDLLILSISLFYERAFNSEPFMFILLFKVSFVQIFHFFFKFKNVSIFLCLSKNKIKRQFDKNTTLTLTKTLIKKQSHSPINFQITLFTYKLDFKIKKYI